MKRYFFVATTLAVAALLSGAAVLSWRLGPVAQAQTPAPTFPVETPGPVTPAAGDVQRTITVVGRASVRVEPDVARLTVGVQTMADEVIQATQDNQDTMNSVLAALEQAGIAEADIQTGQYSIYFNRPPVVPQPTGESQSGQELPRYTVVNVANVTVRDLDTVGQVLDAAVEAGANNVYGINFTVEDPEAVRSQARADAVSDARARAEDLARLGGVELGVVMSMSELVSGGPGPVVAEVAQGGGTPISPGQVELSYQVQVVFFIAP